MDVLAPPDSHHLAAAEGWVELGNYSEARAELALINEQWRRHPAVLSAEWSVSAGEKNWPEALRLARQLVELAPDSPGAWLHQAYALRRVPEGGLRAAWDALFPALKLFPKVAIIPYNLACYACQLNEMAQARDLLKKAIVVGNVERTDHIKKIALHDDDLKALWTEIAGM